VLRLLVNLFLSLYINGLKGFMQILYVGQFTLYNGILYSVINILRVC